ALLLVGGWLLRPRPTPPLAPPRLELAEVVDLVAAMRIATASGLSPLASLEAAVRIVAPDAAPAAPRHAALVDAVDALELPPALRPSLDAVVLAARYGLPLSPVLDRIEAELDGHRRRQTETQVRRLSVRLLFPLVLCFLPAFALVGVVPVLVAAFGV
ncbi:MAG: type II secretion system F family protein, partial [Actinomycetota bacterium]